MVDPNDVLPSLANYSFTLDYVETPWRLVTDLPRVLKAIVSQQGTNIHPSASVHRGAVIVNSYVGEHAKIYEGTTVRDSVIMDYATIGHASEIARSFILNNVMIPRFNYVGSSLIGESVQLGGAAMLASRRHDRKNPVVQWGETRIQLDVDQFGALIGDRSTIAYGCHVNPGAVVAKDTLVLPLVDLSGYIPPNSIVRVKQTIQILRRRPIPPLS